MHTHTHHTHIASYAHCQGSWGLSYSELGHANNLTYCIMDPTDPIFADIKKRSKCNYSVDSYVATYCNFFGRTINLSVTRAKGSRLTLNFGGLYQSYRLNRDS